MPVDRLDTAEWTTRCSRRIVELDSAIGAAEARSIALTMHQVERLTAMAPEAAVDFVQRQMTSERPDRYERRACGR